MKKILSLSIVAALVTLMFATGVMAATQNVTFTVGEVTVDAGTTTVVVPVTVSCDAYPLGISMFEGYIEAAEGLTLTDISGDVSGNTSLGNGDAVVATKKAYICDDDFNDVMAEGAIVFNLTFTIDKPEVAATYAVTMSDDTYAYDEEASDEHNIDIVAGSVTVKAAGSNEPTVNAFADFTSDFVVDAATVGGEPTDYQIGAGLGMKVSTGDLTFTDMIWSLTTADGKLYSKAIALGAVKGDVDLVATFVNGVRAANTFGKEPVTTINFTDVNAIFKDADGAEWFTDVTDAK